jgi:hypothetical protein
MEKIKKHKMNSLQNLEFYQFVKDVINVLKSHELESLKIAEDFEKLNHSFDLFDQCLKKENAFVSPEGMQKADEDRDFFMRKLYAVVSVFYDYPNADKSDAAKALAKVLELYGGSEIAFLPQNKESAAITNLLQDLNVEPSKKNLVTLGLTDVKEMLENANNLFVDFKQNKSNTQALTLRGETKQARQRVVQVWVYICEKINALMVLEPNEKYVDIIVKVNNYIDKYLSAVEIRRNIQEKV